MAGSSFFALLDDIAMLLDDVAVMSKVAVKKTAGVLGDDLALNAQQLTGMSADRELPVIWKVAKGSAINKLILVPAALLLSVFLPALIKPLLIIGGAFLCFEGVEKLYHKWFHKEEEDQHHLEHLKAVVNQDVDLVAFEKEKIKGAIRTDFILSAEIIVIALGTLTAATFTQRVLTLCAVAVILTIGVYGSVALIVKIDDAGLHLNNQVQAWKKALGKFLLLLAPKLLKFLSVAGTIAMFLVGGGILVHSIPTLHHFVEDAAKLVGASPSWLPLLANMLLECAIGVVIGIACLIAFKLVMKVRGKPASAH